MDWVCLKITGLWEVMLCSSVGKCKRFVFTCCVCLGNFGHFHMGDSVAGKQSSATLSTVCKLTYNYVVLPFPVSLPVFKRQQRKGDSNTVGGRLHAVNRVKNLLACNLHAVAGMKGALK